MTVIAIVGCIIVLAYIFMPMVAATQQEAGGVCQGELLRKIPELSHPERYKITSRVRYPRWTGRYQVELTVIGTQDQRKYGKAICELDVTNRGAPVNQQIVREDLTRHLPGTE